MTGVVDLFVEAMVEQVARQERRRRGHERRGEQLISFDEHLKKSQKRRLARYGSTARPDGRKRKLARKAAARARRLEHA